MRLPFLVFILMAAAGLCSPATAGEMFNFLGQNATEDDAKQWATAALNDPTQLGFNSVGTPGQKNFDDRTFSFIVSDIVGSITLYAFSDDGVTVNISNTTTGMSWKALDNQGVGQALPDLTQSFKKCTGTLDSGNSYIVTISYLNTLYTGGGDIDGVAMIGVGGNAVANQRPYFTDPSPTRLNVGSEGIIDIRQLFPGSPGNTTEAANQDTTLTFVLDPANANVITVLEVLDTNNNWGLQAQPYTFNKGEYTSQGRIARIKLKPTAAGDFKITVTAKDSLGAKTDSETKINAVGDNALVAVGDKYNFLPPGDLVIPKAQGVLQNDYIKPSPMAGQLTVTLTTGADHGDVMINNDGSFTYSPKGSDPFWDQ